MDIKSEKYCKCNETWQTVKYYSFVFTINNSPRISCQAEHKHLYHLFYDDVKNLSAFCLFKKLYD
jgi:hypothetical protein